MADVDEIIGLRPNVASIGDFGVGTCDWDGRGIVCDGGFVVPRGIAEVQAVRHRYVDIGEMGDCLGSFGAMCEGGSG